MGVYDYNTILARARTVKSNVEKSKKIGINTRWSYYFAKSIILPNKDINQIDFSEASKSTGNDLNSKILKKDYLDMSKRLISFVEKNKSLPNYITWGNKKVCVQDYVYMLARIVVYYKDNKALPNYAVVNSNVFKPSTKSKYGHAIKTGCDNMGQNTGYYCACHSLQEVFRNLTGIVVKQSTIASWAGTTSAGTGHSGMDTAVAKFNKTYGKKLKVTWKNFNDLGWSGIDKIVKSKNQDCIIHNLYRDQYGHYEVVNGVSSNINVQNSLGSKCSNGCYCGYIEYRSQSTFRRYISGISQKSIMVITNEG